MNTPLSNFIPLNRKVFKHQFWLDKRAYSRFEAWLDLLATARFDHTEGRLLIGNTVVRYGRGELVASIRFLMERWGWTKNKVEAFLKLLKSENMIKTRTADRTHQTVISICNYDTYNGVVEKSGQAAGQYPDTNQTTCGQEPDKSNKENKEQKSEEREIYRGFAHLVLFTNEYLNLLAAGYTQTQINQVLDAIENYKNNKKYTSLYLTAKRWLERDAAANSRGFGDSASFANNSKNTGGRIVNIASAFQNAMRHG